MQHALQNRINPNAQAVLSAWTGGKKPSTLRSYRESLKLFSKFESRDGFAVNPVQALERFIGLRHGEANLEALEFRRWMEQNEYAPNSIGLHLAALRSFVKAANVVDAVAWTLNIKSPKAEVIRDTRGPSPE